MGRGFESPGGERLLRLIMVGIVAWGVFQAVGAWTLNHDARRPLIVLACVAAFLGFWLAMLAVRRRRLGRGIVDRKAVLESGGE